MDCLSFFETDVSATLDLITDLASFDVNCISSKKKWGHTKEKSYPYLTVQSGNSE